MAIKIIEVPSLGPVSFQKRRGSRSVRLKIAPNGKIVVTQPYFLPYKAAVKFVEQHKDWVEKELSRRIVGLEDGMRIGRAHDLRFEYDKAAVTPRVRVTSNEIVVRHSHEDLQHDDLQMAAMRGATRALKKEAAQFLPKRLQDIARREGYEYQGVTIKQMRSRWGSCNQDKHITLNIFLMELPVELIDYVILHEFAHTRHLNHGPEFWNEFILHLPEARQLRKQIREYHPAIPARRMA